MDGNSINDAEVVGGDLVANAGNPSRFLSGEQGSHLVPSRSTNGTKNTSDAMQTGDGKILHS